jgi:hypothetical protein
MNDKLKSIIDKHLCVGWRNCDYSIDGDNNENNNMCSDCNFYEMALEIEALDAGVIGDLKQSLTIMMMLANRGIAFCNVSERGHMVDARKLLEKHIQHEKNMEHELLIKKFKSNSDEEK